MSPETIGRDEPDLTDRHALADTKNNDDADPTTLGEWLSAQGLDIAAEVEETYHLWLPEFDVRTPFEHDQLRNLVTEAIRIKRCYDEEFARTARDAARARLCWEEDRAAEIHAIVAKLHRNPERWRAALVRSAQGCRWMIDQWRGLATLIREGKTFDARQRSRALDLLGVPPLFRDAATPIDPPQNAEPDYLAQRIQQEIDHLQTMIDEAHEPYEAVQRHHVERGLTISFERDVMALRRFEAGCHRRFQQLIKVLRKKTLPSSQTAQPSNTPKTRSLFTPHSHSSINQPHFSGMFRTETERCSARLTAADEDEPEVMPTSRPSAVATVSAPPTAAAPAFQGNRKQRRRAQALARRKS